MRAVTMTPSPCARSEGTDRTGHWGGAPVSNRRGRSGGSMRRGVGVAARLLLRGFTAWDVPLEGPGQTEAQTEAGKPTASLVSHLPMDTT